MNGLSFSFNSSYFTLETKIPPDLPEKSIILLDILNYVQQTSYGHADLLCKVQKSRTTLNFILLPGLLKARTSGVSSHTYSLSM